ncbi:MAG: hypothetical protein HYY37_02665 [Candidatus Aenigmarchaeota archaeon]|nr:hypothetical protein [Candidatus Aenigmarchaeota archaeon]
MDEFIGGLIGLLLVLAILMLVTGFVFAPTPSVPPQPGVNLSGTYLVGPTGETALQRIAIGSFNISYIRSTRDIGLGSDYLHNGLLFGSNRMVYHLDEKDVESIDVFFTVAKTNSYAPLSIQVNGETVSERTYVPGEYTVPIDRGLFNESVTVEIAPQSSSWRIWAPTVYALEDVTLRVRSFSSQIKEHDFDVFETAYNNFQSGKITVMLDENVGQFNAEMNGQLIRSGAVKDVDVIRFNQSALKLGKNTVAFKPELNSVFSGTANMSIEYTSGIVSFLEVPFNVTRLQWENLATRSGTIRFTVVQVSKPGGLQVKLIGDSTELYSDFAKAEASQYEFKFGKNDVYLGANRVQIHSAAGALFSVKDVNVTL